MSASAPSRVSTRAKNATQHHGGVVEKRKRRTKAEIERDNALKLAAKNAKEEAKNASVKRVAALEDSMALQDAAVDGAHPRHHRDIVTKPAKHTAVELTDSEGEQPAKKKQASKNDRRKTITHAPEQVILSDDDKLTDLDEPALKPTGRSLVRTYSMAYIPSLPKSPKVSKVPVQESDGGDYEPPTDREPGSGCDTEMQDLTPKKKEKVPLRDVIKATREEPPSRREQKVPSKQGHTSTQDFKTTNLLKQWRSQVPQAASITSRTTSSASTVTHTTGSSNATVTAQKNQRSKKVIESEDHIDTTNYGGLEDEDESAERQAAISSPIKGNKRLTSTSIVKLEQVSPPPKRVRKERYLNRDLPKGSQDNNSWRRSFLPSYIQYLGTLDNVWNINDNDAVGWMQRVWDYIYGAGIPYNINVDGPVFYIADQRVCVWRSTFASAPIAILDSFFDMSSIDTDDARRAFAVDALHRYAFLYEDVSEDENGVLRRKGMFRGPLVLETFAAHLSAIQGAVTIPQLGKLGNPAGALAISTAAVERALNLWKAGHITCETPKAQRTKTSVIIRTINQLTGKESTTMTNFNYPNSGRATQAYLLSIKKNLDDKKFSRIIAEAKACSRLRNGNRGPTSTTLVPSDYEDDERALLSDDEDDLE